MERSYKIAGMTCTGCAQIVHNLLSKVSGTKKVMVDLDKAQAVIQMDTFIPTEKLKQALVDSLYQLSEMEKDLPQKTLMSEEEILEKNKMLVSDYITAAGLWQYKLLREYLHPDFEFNGALHLHSANDYLKMIKEHAQSGPAKIVLKNDIKAIFADGNEACVIYDVITDTAVESVPFFEKIIIKDGKIVSTEVKFDRYRMKQLMQEVSEMNKQS